MYKEIENPWLFTLQYLKLGIDPENKKTNLDNDRNKSLKISKLKKSFYKNCILHVLISFFGEKQKGRMIKPVFVFIV